MSEILLTIARELPAVAALILVVVIYVRNSRDDRTAFIRALEQRDERMERVIGQTDETQRQTVAALQRSTDQHVRSESVLQRIDLHLRPLQPPQQAG